ncbi:hypothetical protein BCO71033_06743 [Burkholderia contaminans]|uniref:Uncharacterized protein n=1 Tax=Burkholderia contaminans TaxID=488447 RepID=A0A6P3BPR4_9BURK|nr:hypothetical protein BCO71033_06743 [Burkholderia contaminans]
MVGALSIASGVSSTAAAVTVAERYPAPWREDFNLEISKSLAWNKVRGCGEFKYRASSQDQDEYLVYCTADGSMWTAYLVWTAIHKVMGPLKPDASIQ